MHIPDGFVSAELNAATFVVSLAVGAVALVKANRTLGEKQVPLLGVTAAFIFAAQMLNFPVAGGTSGHFLGAVLGSILLGPLNTFLALAIVLLIQCLVFADGGLTALGSNIFNMAIIGGVGGYGIFRCLKFVLPRSKTGFLASAALAAWTSVVLASAACAAELALSGTSPLVVAMPAMIGVHVLIGIGEAIITTVVVSMVIAVRPDLIPSWDRGIERQVQEA